MFGSAFRSLGKSHSKALIAQTRLDPEPSEVRDVARLEREARVRGPSGARRMSFDGSGCCFDEASGAAVKGLFLALVDVVRHPRICFCVELFSG